MPASFAMKEAPIVQPWPGSVAGAHALVELFKALQRMGTEVGVGGCLGVVGSTSLIPLPPKKTKRPVEGGITTDGPLR